MDFDPGRVLIVGAGDLGLGVAAVLARRGMDVTTLNRTGRGVEGTARVVADLADPASLTGIVADTVVFTTAPPGRDDAAYRLAYVDGPARVLDALASVPRRVVLTSTTGVHGADDGRWVDAHEPPDPSRPTAVIVAEGEAALADRAPCCVVRPAGIYGPGRGRFAERVAAGMAPVAADGTPRWTNRVHRDDVVAALATVTTCAAPPPAVIAVDDEPARRDDVIRWLVDRLDAPDPPTVEVERESGKRCRNTALRALGWVPRYPSYREGYAELTA